MRFNKISPKCQLVQKQAAIGQNSSQQDVGNESFEFTQLRDMMREEEARETERNKNDLTHIPLGLPFGLSRNRLQTSDYTKACCATPTLSTQPHDFTWRNLPEQEDLEEKPILVKKNKIEANCKVEDEDKATESHPSKSSNSGSSTLPCKPTTTSVAETDDDIMVVYHGPSTGTIDKKGFDQSHSTHASRAVTEKSFEQIRFEEGRKKISDQRYQKEVAESVELFDKMMAARKLKRPKKKDHEHLMNKMRKALDKIEQKLIWKIDPAHHYQTYKHLFEMGIKCIKGDMINRSDVPIWCERIHTYYDPKPSHLSVKKYIDHIISRKHQPSGKKFAPNFDVTKRGIDSADCLKSPDMARVKKEISGNETPTRIKITISKMDKNSSKITNVTETTFEEERKKCDDVVAVKKKLSDEKEKKTNAEMKEKKTSLLMKKENSKSSFGTSAMVSEKEKAEKTMVQNMTKSPVVQEKRKNEAYENLKRKNPSDRDEERKETKKKKIDSGREIDNGEKKRQDQENNEEKKKGILQISKTELSDKNSSIDIKKDQTRENGNCSLLSTSTPKLEPGRAPISKYTIPKKTSSSTAALSKGFDMALESALFERRQKKVQDKKKIVVSKDNVNLVDRIINEEFGKLDSFKRRDGDLSDSIIWDKTLTNDQSSTWRKRLNSTEASMDLTYDTVGILKKPQPLVPKEVKKIEPSLLASASPDVSKNIETSVNSDTCKTFPLTASDDNREVTSTNCSSQVDSSDEQSKLFLLRNSRLEEVKIVVDEEILINKHVHEFEVPEIDDFYVSDESEESVGSTSNKEKKMIVIAPAEMVEFYPTLMEQQGNLMDETCQQDRSNVLTDKHPVNLPVSIENTIEQEQPKQPKIIRMIKPKSIINCDKVQEDKSMDSPIIKEQTKMINMIKPKPMMICNKISENLLVDPSRVVVEKKPRTINIIKPRSIINCDNKSSEDPFIELSTKTYDPPPAKKAKFIDAPTLRKQNAEPKPLTETQQCKERPFASLEDIYREVQKKDINATSNRDLINTGECLLQQADVENNSNFSDEDELRFDKLELVDQVGSDSDPDNSDSSDKRREKHSTSPMRSEEITITNVSAEKKGYRLIPIERDDIDLGSNYVKYNRPINSDSHNLMKKHIQLIKAKNKNFKEKAFLFSPYERTREPVPKKFDSINKSPFMKLADDMKMSSSVPRTIIPPKSCDMKSLASRQKEDNWCTYRFLPHEIEDKENHRSRKWGDINQNRFILPFNKTDGQWWPIIQPYDTPMEKYDNILKKKMLAIENMMPCMTQYSYAQKARLGCGWDVEAHKKRYKSVENKSDKEMAAVGRFRNRKGYERVFMTQSLDQARDADKAQQEKESKYLEKLKTIYRTREVEATEIELNRNDEASQPKLRKMQDAVRWNIIDEFSSAKDLPTGGRGEVKLAPYCVRMAEMEYMRLYQRFPIFCKVMNGYNYQLVNQYKRSYRSQKDTILKKSIRAIFVHQRGNTGISGWSDNFLLSPADEQLAQERETKLRALLTRGCVDVSELLELCRLQPWERKYWTLIWDHLVSIYKAYGPVSQMNIRKNVEKGFQRTISMENRKKYSEAIDEYVPNRILPAQGRSYY